MQNEGLARSVKKPIIRMEEPGARSDKRSKKCVSDVLGVSNYTRLDATFLARLSKSHLPPCPPRLLLLEPGMLRRAGVIECVDDQNDLVLLGGTDQEFLK